MPFPEWLLTQNLAEYTSENESKNNSDKLLKKKLVKTDYDIDTDLSNLPLLEKGTYGCVYLAKKKLSKCTMAIKVQEKDQIVKRGSELQIQREIKIHMHLSDMMIVNILLLISYIMIVNLILK